MGMIANNMAHWGVLDPGTALQLDDPLLAMHWCNGLHNAMACARLSM